MIGISNEHDDGDKISTVRWSYQHLFGVSSRMPRLGRLWLRF